MRDFPMKGDYRWDPETLLWYGEITVYVCLSVRHTPLIMVEPRQKFDRPPGILFLTLFIDRPREGFDPLQAHIILCVSERS